MDSNAKTNSTFDRWMERTLLLVTVIVSALAMSPSVADPDLWGHVQFGRDVFADGEIAETTSYSFTAEGYRWINHENLSEIVMAWTVNNWGNAGLLFGKLMLSLFVIGSILWFNLRRGAGLVATCAMTILVAWNLGYHWSFRPQLSSFFFYTLMIILLQFAFHHWRDNWHFAWFKPKFLTRGDSNEEIKYCWMHSRLLWLAPVLFVLWTNSHGGFVAGVCVFVAYVGCRAIEAVSSGGFEGSKAGWGLLRRMSLMAVVAVLATFLNPYSHRLPLWLLESLGSPRPEILDWSSDQLYGLVGFKFWALIAMVIAGLALSRKSLDFTQTVILAITLWQAVSHFRHVPFFAIAAGFWVTPHVDSMLARFTSKTSTNDNATQTSFMESATGKRIAVVIAVLVIGLLGYRMSQRLNDVRVQRDTFPVDAMQFMRSNGVTGKIVVTYDWAQYTIAALCLDQNLEPGETPSRVAFDGRFRTCYPQELVDMHFDLLFGEGPHVQRHRSPDSPPCDPSRVLNHGQPDVVLLRRHGERSERHMNTQTENWSLLYQDGLAQVWGRKTVFGNPSSPRFVAEDKRSIRDEMPSGYFSWPALPKVPQSAIANTTSRTDEQIAISAN